MKGNIEQCKALGNNNDDKKKQVTVQFVLRVEQIEQLLVGNVGSVMQPLHQLLEPTPDEVSKIKLLRLEKCE